MQQPTTGTSTPSGAIQTIARSLSSSARNGEKPIGRKSKKIPYLVQGIEKFRANDLPGSPLVYHYDGIGQLSPTTLRYIKILGDLQNLFGSLGGMRIHEIGVGYGGQCRVIQAAEQPALYTLIDLQPALALAQRYLDHFALAFPVAYITMNELQPCTSDLVISNYAFSELRRDIQEIYLSRLIQHSKRGYMLLSKINPDDFNSCSYDELVAAIPGSRLLREEPLTYPGNALLVWGETEKSVSLG
jgi:hypothetical protein